MNQPRRHVSVGINVRLSPCHKTQAWGIVAHDGYTHAQTYEPASDLVGLLQAFEHVLVAEHFVGATIDLYCADETFVDHVRPFAAAWPHLTFKPAGTGALVRAARITAAEPFRDALHIGLAHAAAVHELRRNPPPANPARLLPVLTAATDGSAVNGTSTRTAGYGWVLEDGRHGFGTLKAPTLMSEVAAIHDLLQTTKHTQPLVILTDARQAIKIVTDLQAGTPIAQAAPSLGSVRFQRRLTELTEQLQARQGRLRFEWVKGHSGHPMNEAADRLAVLARREVDIRLPASVVAQNRERIVADMLTELAEQASTN